MSLSDFEVTKQLGKGAFGSVILFVERKIHKHKRIRLIQ